DFAMAPASRRSHAGQRYPSTSAQQFKCECDVFVIAVGNENAADKLVLYEGWEFLESELLDCAVGLRTRDGKIRVLGAAAVSSDRFKDMVNSRNRPDMLQNHVKSLPLQIQFPGRPNPSVPVSARLVGEANRYFEEHSDRWGPNWNCAFAPNIVQ